MRVALARAPRCSWTLALTWIAAHAAAADSSYDTTAEREAILAGTAPVARESDLPTWY